MVVWKDARNSWRGEEEVEIRREAELGLPEGDQGGLIGRLVGGEEAGELEGDGRFEEEGIVEEGEGEVVVALIELGEGGFEGTLESKLFGRIARSFWRRGARDGCLARSLMVILRISSATLVRRAMQGSCKQGFGHEGYFMKVIWEEGEVGAVVGEEDGGGRHEVKFS